MLYPIRTYWLLHLYQYINLSRALVLYQGNIQIFNVELQ